MWTPQLGRPPETEQECKEAMDWWRANRWEIERKARLEELRQVKLDVIPPQVEYSLSKYLDARTRSTNQTIFLTWLFVAIFFGGPILLFLLLLIAH
jgi:hypothetical protein